jgi:hypothetical protein
MKWMPNDVINQEVRSIVWRAFCSHYYGGMGQAAHPIMQIVAEGIRWRTEIVTVAERALYDDNPDPDHPNINEFLKSN